MTLTDITTLCQCETGSNDNEGEHQPAQISRTKALPSDVVYCHTYVNTFLWGSYPFARDTECVISLTNWATSLLEFIYVSV